MQGRRDSNLPRTGMGGSQGPQGKTSPRQPSGSSQPGGGTDGREDGKRPKWTMPKWANIALTLSTIALTLVAFLLGGRYVLNMRFLDSYANGSYNAAIPNTLTYLNFPDPYLPYHNFGCATFMMGNYDYAAGAFLTALENDPPHDEPYPSRECQTRINLALALTRPLDIDHWRTENERQKLIGILTEARGYLTEDGCANPAKDVFDGHSADAEQLKKDIDKALEKLSDPNNKSDDESDESDDQQGEGGQDEQQSDGQDGQSRQSEDRLKERLNDRKSDAMQDRAEEHQTWDDLSNFGQGGSAESGGSQQGEGGAPSGKTW